MIRPKVLYQFPELAGKPFRPSNGTEGMIFEEHFCSQCIHQNPDPTKGKNCDTACAAFCFDLKDKDYPKEWIYDSEGWPICTKWVKWDWDNDGDPDNPDNPNVVPPVDPRQLNLFPLHPTEKDFVIIQEPVNQGRTIHG